MDMLMLEQVTKAGLADWRKMGQGLHARYRTGDFQAGVRFLAALGDVPTDHVRATIGDNWIDLKLISQDAVHQDQAVEWVTQTDVDLAHRITGVAASLGLVADPASITVLELALDTARAKEIAPMWAALLTGSTEAQGRGTIGDDVRDLTARVPILWFQETDQHDTPRQRFHLDVWVAPEEREARIAAAVAAGGVIVDDSQAPGFVVLADADGNKACVCIATY
ncbi:4a-hydroxytetrahydrobiopterin dehydratase [Actinoplanes bogorensis]|uniref:4a-hydroxytetrahydrobiopterin dehydratase n=1 Tax=Paractinoplanes bogorensis TaxID=1610840 RepID=A0ABS5YQ68_9ACTN|nr:VOC family protein [Actinoplanes bogorensis]MBU2664155.1 4a-hydroxytetrahydrobiopterin dehydratase [Actinoplanes bogorensis]